MGGAFDSSWELGSPRGNVVSQVDQRWFQFIDNGRNTGTSVANDPARLKCFKCEVQYGLQWDQTNRHFVITGASGATSGQIVNPLEPIISNVNTHLVFALSRSVVSSATPLLSARDVSKLRPATRTRPRISLSKLVDNAGQVIPEAALPVSPQDQMISWLTDGSTNSLRVDHSTLGLAKIPVTSPMILPVVSTLPLLMVLVWPAVSTEHLVTPSLIISSLEDTLLTVKSFSHGATSAVTQVLTATRLGDQKQKKIGPPTGSGTARPTHCRQVTKIKVITYADR